MHPISWTPNKGVKYNQERGVFLMPRKNKKYSPEFKIKVVEYKFNNDAGYTETAKYFDLYVTVNGYQYPAEGRVRAWERIYLEKGKEGFYVETRGRKNTRSKKLDPQVEEDLIAKCQRLEMENEYLKKLSALVHAREQREKK